MVCGVSAGIEQRERFAAGRKLARIRAHHEESLTSARPGGAGAELADVRADIHHAVGGQHRARMEGELDGTLELPIAEIQGEAGAVGEHKKLLSLVA